jgi:hypothetical protein
MPLGGSRRCRHVDSARSRRTISATLAWAKSNRDKLVRDTPCVLEAEGYSTSG